MFLNNLDGLTSFTTVILPKQDIIIIHYIIIPINLLAPFIFIH
uniref:Uncharacterized protein n=1 Tax=Anguilla anguilla TaxID=7936 RepID=A0A0E9XJR4_ANGAN